MGDYIVRLNKRKGCKALSSIGDKSSNVNINERRLKLNGLVGECQAEGRRGGYELPKDGALDLEKGILL